VKRILVIRLSAFGDFVQSFGPFAAIRAHHPDADISLLTTAPFADLATEAPWFNRVLIDSRPPWWNFPAVVALASKLRGFDFVYDLQTSARSARYFVLAGRPPWSGISPGCSHPHANPGRDAMHTRERQREQLAMAAIGDFPAPAMDWLTGHGRNFDLPTPYALLAPGAAPGRPRKRWPAENYGELAASLAGRTITPVILGTDAEAPLATRIRSACPSAIDLTGATNFADIAALASRAAFAVGNDTGPMHLIAATGCHCAVLFSADSDPTLTAPRGPNGEWPTVLREPVLADLSVPRVAAILPIGP
jgi:ADP-heptose:LPS heptosyltransferase